MNDEERDARQDKYDEYAREAVYEKRMEDFNSWKSDNLSTLYELFCEDHEDEFSDYCKEIYLDEIQRK